MATIDYDAIESKIQAYISSKDGMKDISTKLEKVNKIGLGRIEPMMREAGDVFRDCLVSAMSHLYVTSSIIDIVADESSFVMSDPVVVKMTYNQTAGASFTGYLTFSFEPESIYRPSLERGWRTSDGIDNIVSLFDTGYETKTVYGYWASHGKKVKSRAIRDELGFMIAAVDDFNNRFGKKYQCVAKIVADAEYYAR